MQVTEKLAEGLKRELHVVVQQGQLGERFNAAIEGLREQVQLKGFRRGKVPAAHLKKLFGRRLMADVLQEIIEEASRKAITERNERPAGQPNIDFGGAEALERVMAGDGDLTFTLSFEVLPPIELADFASFHLVREVADVTDEAIDKGIHNLVEHNIKYEAEAEREAQHGDRLTIDFVGRIDGAEFEGGKGEEVTMILGRGGLLAGLEEGLKGAKAGEERAIMITFPDDYPRRELAGKQAEFAVKVKEVAKPVRPAVDDEFAKTLGVDTVARLRELVRARIRSDYDTLSRLRLKRQLLDALDKSHNFALPESLVAREFEALWRQFSEDLKAQGKTLAEAGKSEEELRAEYRRLAERRVRLGLLIGEIGDKNKIEVTREELRSALVEQAHRYPGRERFVYQYYEKNPAALDELRAPLFEDKVVDHILSLVKPVEKKVAPEELLSAADGQAEGHRHGHEPHSHGSEPTSPGTG
jgi:trigger factor